MKKLKGFSVVSVIICIAIVALIGIGAYLVIDGNNNATDFKDYDFYSVIAPDKNNGNIGDHVKGDENAPALIFEYADYQCPGCASINTKVNKAVEELKKEYDRLEGEGTVLDNEVEQPVAVDTPVVMEEYVEPIEEVTEQ